MNLQEYLKPKGNGHDTQLGTGSAIQKVNNIFKIRNNENSHERHQVFSVIKNKLKHYIFVSFLDNPTFSTWLKVEHK